MSISYHNNISSSASPVIFLLFHAKAYFEQGKSQELIRRNIDEEQSGVKTTLIDNPDQNGKGAFDNTQTYGSTVIQNRVSAYDSNTLVVHDEQTVKDGVADSNGTPAKDTAAKHVDRNYGSFTKEQYGDGTNANKFKTNIKDTQNDIDNTDKRKNHLIEAETGGDSSKSGTKNKQHNKTNNAYVLENENESYNTNNRDFDHYMHSYGNWGISQTAQKLLLSEFETRFKTNPYELMAIIYIKEMTDGVWV